MLSTLGLWKREEIRVDIKKFPDYGQNPVWQYPPGARNLEQEGDFEIDFFSAKTFLHVIHGNTVSNRLGKKFCLVSYPLSARTFVYVVDDETPYFGRLSESINPFSPYGSDDSHFTLFTLPTFSSFFANRHLEVRHSRVTKQPYLFET